jgi:hypothetical protein
MMDFENVKPGDVVSVSREEFEKAVNDDPYAFRTANSVQSVKSSKTQNVPQGVDVRDEVHNGPYSNLYLGVGRKPDYYPFEVNEKTLEKIHAALVETSNYDLGSTSHTYAVFNVLHEDDKPYMISALVFIGPVLWSRFDFL